MSVLLNNTDKDKIVDAGGMSYVSRAPKATSSVADSDPDGPSSIRQQIDPMVDLGNLDVCFGGFTPMALNDDPATRERVLQAEQRARERKETSMKAAAIEAARASEVRIFDDGMGCTWQYVVLDDSQVRIEGCDCDDAADVSELIIPTQIEGKPVVALAADACSCLPSVEAVRMPDTVVSVGYCAFRDCHGLQEIEFSRNLAAFDSGWMRGCHKVEHMRLPGALEKLVPSIFDILSLRTLVVGAGTSEVMPGACARSQLERIEIDADNPFLSTDGVAVYTKDRAALLALVVAVEEYDISEECVAIARKGLSTFEALQRVGVPDGLELIGDFAFTRTGIKRFDAPPALRAIGERAFFACASLAEISLNEGLLVIGDNAFTDTILAELRIPATVRELGNPVAAGTGLTYSGRDATFSIVCGDADASKGVDIALAEHAAGNGAGIDGSVVAGGDAAIWMDEAGGLYRNAEDGLHFVRMMEPAAEEYSIAEGTTFIDEAAFAKHPNIMRITLPDGLTSIDKGAFKDCRRLTVADLPQSLQTLGDEAFFSTSLESLRIPSSLGRIGALALITYGAHHGPCEPSLRHIEVDLANPRYRMESGLLIERMDNGSDRVILCTGEVEDVVIPESVTVIASYAFNGVRRLRSLSISDRVTAVDVRGLAFDCLPECIHIDVVEPIEGHASFDFRFPNTSRAALQVANAFGAPSFIDVAAIFDHYDNSIVHRRSIDGLTVELDAYQQAKLLIDRLRDPLLMTPTNRGLCDQVLRSHMAEFCTAIARRDDKQSIDGLLDLGYIDKDNIEEVIDAVGAVQDASITNHLLDQKRRRFGAAAIDFEL